jgi:hypothetical protein
LGTTYVSDAEISNFSQGRGIPRIDPRETGSAPMKFIGQAFHRAGAKISEKGHFRMETNKKSKGKNKHGNVFCNLNGMTGVATRTANKMLLFNL